MMRSKMKNDMKNLTKVVRNVKKMMTKNMKNITVKVVRRKRTRKMKITMKSSTKMHKKKRTNASLRSEMKKMEMRGMKSKIEQKRQRRR